MNKKIVETLKPLNIPTYYMQCSKQTDKYIIFSIYREVDADKYDNKNLSEVYYIQVNYWYRFGDYMSLYKDIKKLLKENGFRFTGCRDMIDGQYLAKSMDFIYKNFDL